jgi:radical SAM protein with 4Fe4S-binding SPASM domain
MSNFYCAAPWRGLHINPQGSIKTCCAGNPHMLGNLNDLDIEQALNSEKAQEIRASLSQGKPHEYCSNCVKAERFGAESERHWHNRVNPDFDRASAGSDYHYPVIVDVRWNTTCNLSCNYCDPANSSKWASLRHIPFKSQSRPYYEQVCDFLEQHNNHIHEVALVGGEPLLLPENERLLDVIPNDCIVTLITNMSQDLESNRIFKKLAQRKRVGWSMSFDNTGAHYEYVRHGGKWDLLLNNLQQIKSLFHTQGHWGGIHAVYNLYNATKLVEFKQFAQEQGLSITWMNLFGPEALDPFLHGPDVAQLAAQQIEILQNQHAFAPSEQAFFAQALEKYRRGDLPKNQIKNKFCNFTLEIENRFHPDTKGQFDQLWPELAHLCK